MKFSILTATYNSSKTIFDCINSVNEQTYPDIEHIIIDGGSADNTLEVIKELAIGDLKIISEHDEGIYDALNKGIKIAKGDIIGILHSDDEFAADDILEKVKDKFKKTNADVVYGDLIYVSQKNKNKKIRYWKSIPFERNLVNKGWMPAHPTVFLRKEVYQKIGVFDLQFKIAADYDLMLRLMLNSELKFEYLPVVITRMRVGGMSNKSIKNILKKSVEDYRALRKNKLSRPIMILFRKNLNKVVQFL